MDSLDGDIFSSDLLWDDDFPRSDSVLGDSIWHLATSHDEDIVTSQSLLHSRDPLLTSALVTVGDEAEQVNDLLFDELERITISSPSPQLDLGMVSLLFYYLLTHTTCWLLFISPSSGLLDKEFINDNLTPHLNAHSLPFSAFPSFLPSC